MKSKKKINKTLMEAVFPFQDFLLNYTSTQQIQIANSLMKMLIQPFEHYEAYNVGIIDEKGNKVMSDENIRLIPKSNIIYGRLVRLAIGLKKLINKYPVEKQKFNNWYSTLYYLMESIENDRDEIDIEEYIDCLQRPLNAHEKWYATMLYQDLFETNKIPPDLELNDDEEKELKASILDEDPTVSTQSVAITSKPIIMVRRNGKYD